MAHQLKTLAKSDDLSLIPGTDMEEEEKTDSTELSSDTHVGVVMCVCVQLWARSSLGCLLTLPPLQQDKLLL